MPLAAQKLSMSQTNQTPPDSGNSQAEIVALLQSTINKLQGMVNSLNSAPQTSLPTKASVEKLVAITQELTTELETTKIITTTPVAEVKPKIDKTPPSRVTRTQPQKAKKTSIPSSWVVGSIVIGIILGIIIYALPINKSEEIVKLPLVEIKETPPVVNTPPVEKVSPPSEEKSEKTEKPEKSEPKVTQPSPTPIPRSPQLRLPPEQTLIAAIQNQVAEITSEYVEGLIISTEANFLGSILIVKVSDNWYGLTETEQNKLANEVLIRSRELDFKKLEIVDLEANLLARSPVVGNNMVMLKREIINN